MPLHMIELRPDAGRLFAFLQAQGLLHDGHLGYGVHAWLRAAFGDLAPRPWRLFWDRQRPARVLGYARCDALTLYQRLQDYAEPLAASVCPFESLASKEMPAFPAGRTLRFEVLAAPVGRKSRSGQEKDLFLLAVEKKSLLGQAPPSRHETYCQWVREQLESQGSCQVLTVAPLSFRLVRQLRRTQPPDRKTRTLTCPEVLFSGRLRVTNPDAFGALLARGVGRHRAFGYGMILLRPDV